LVYKFGMKPHTEAKHRILELYLEKWFPILNKLREGVAYIDGFAGPGRYREKERGSPIIALETANKYSGKPGFYARIWLIETDAKRHASLTKHVGQVELKEGIRVEGILKSTFEKSLPDIVEKLQADGMPPTFVFVDPTGYSGVKMSTLAKFLENPRCEFMFTFMESSLERSLGNSEDARKRSLNDLFGTCDWEEGFTMKGYEQIKFFLALYTKQLRLHGVKYTLPFEMRRKTENTIYHLVFATNSKRGLEAMKESMVKVDPKFTFGISDVMVTGQTHLVSFESDKGWYSDASDLIFQKYHGKANVPLEEIKCFVITDTPYVWRAGIMKRMQDAGLASKTPYEPVEKIKKELKYLITFSKSRPVQARGTQTRLDQDSWGASP